MIAHSLGNLVFDMDFMEQTMEGVTLTATFRDDRLVRVDAHAVPDGRDFAPRPVAGPAADGDPRRRVGAAPPDPFRADDAALIQAQRSQASTIRPVRSSWAGCTTAGTSPGEW